MLKTYTNSIFLMSVLLSALITGSVRIQHRYSLGDKFTYGKNKTSTIVNLFTGEKKVEQEETIYTDHIVELDDPLTNASAEIEKSYSFARFIPVNERESRRLLSQRTRENFQKVIGSSLQEYAVGDRWTDKTFPAFEKHYIITRIYESDEYDTEVITIDTEMVGTLEALGYRLPVHYLTTRDIDVETGILLFEESIDRFTAIHERKTDITVTKLIKRETDIHEL